MRFTSKAMLLKLGQKSVFLPWLLFGLSASHFFPSAYSTENCGQNIQNAIEQGVLKNETFLGKSFTIRDLQSALSDPEKGLAMNQLINPEKEVLIGLQTTQDEIPHYFLLAGGKRLDGLIIEPVKIYNIRNDYAPTLPQKLQDLFYLKIGNLTKEQIDNLLVSMDDMIGTRQFSCSFSVCKALKEGAGVEFYSPSGMHLFLETTLVSILQKGVRNVTDQAPLPVEVLKIKGGSLAELAQKMATQDQQITQGQFIEILQRPGISKKFLKEPLPANIVEKIRSQNPPSKELILEIEEQILQRRKLKSEPSSNLSGTAQFMGAGIAFLSVGRLTFMIQGNSWQLKDWQEAN